MREENLLSIACDAVEKASAVSGVAMAEAYVKKGRDIEIDVRDGKIETIKSAEEHGIGLRVFYGSQVGFAYSTKLDMDGIADTVRRAIANAGETEPDQYLRLPDVLGPYPEVETLDADLLKRGVEEKIGLAKRVEQAARAYDPRVEVIESSTYQDSVVDVAIANSKGLAFGFQGGACGVYASLTAGEDGESQTGFALDFRMRFADLDPEEVGRQAAYRAVRMLGARQQGSRETTLVLEPYVVVSLLGVLAPALSGEAVQKGRSLFAGRMGERVASDLVTIVDDGTLPGGINSGPCDGEGVPTSRTVVIEHGVLSSFLHNSYTAAKDGLVSTGNGVRGSFKGAPEVGTTNFFLSPGEPGPEQLLEELDSGLLVTEVMGMHTANPISGDFSVGASGLWIEKGRISHPVRGMAIAGNIKDLLVKIDAVGSDLQFFGGKGAPTVRVRQMMVSGS